ncbi:Hypothetical protein UVM_LOCUS9, partial [uncultured virus]
VHFASFVRDQEADRDRLLLVRTGVECLAAESALGAQVFTWLDSQFETPELFATDTFALGWQKRNEQPSDWHPSRVRTTIYDFLRRPFTDVNKF